MIRRWWRSHTLRIRLTLWYLAAMIVVIGVYVTAVYAFVSRRVSDTLDQQVRRDFQWVAATVYQTGAGSFTWNEPPAETAEEEPPWVQVWSPGGALVFATPEALRRPIPESRVLALRPGATSDTPARMLTPSGGYRVLSRRGTIGASPVVIQVARSELSMREDLNDLLIVLVFGLPVAVAVAGLGGYTLARRALLPIERMTDRARSITADRLSDRLPVAHPDDEMGRLATVFNETLARLEASFDQMRRFTADVSHELRTPLTAIRSVGEVGLREHRTDAQYRSIIGSMLEEADRLATLVDRLLTLSRAESGLSVLARAETDLVALVDEVAADLMVLAEEKRQTIVVERSGGVRASCDRVGLRQALINLVDNAIKYSPAGGEIRVRVREAHGEAHVDVSDSGPGIDPAARPRIFDRFYRAGTGGTAPGSGLGLSIAKGAVDASGGRLVLVASGAGGSTFRITLPLWDGAKSQNH